MGKPMFTIDPKTGAVSGHGSVAQRLLANNMNVNALRTNDTLKRLEWQEYDTAIVKAYQRQLNGVAALIRNGLEYNIANGFGRTVLVTQTVSDISDAELSMDGVTPSNKDRAEYGLGYLPLPISHKDYSINARALAASRNLGEAMDTTMAELSGRKVGEKVEKMLFLGSSSYTFGGGTIYGLVDFPDRNTGSLTAGWLASGASGSTILKDVRNMKQALINARFRGPYLVFAPSTYETVLDDDFKSLGEKTIRQRILEIGGIQEIVTSDFISGNNVYMVQLTPDVIRMVNAMPLSNVEWGTEGNMRLNYKVMAIMVPQIRSDYSKRCGIAHYSA